MQVLGPGVDEGEEGEDDVDDGCREGVLRCEAALDVDAAAARLLSDSCEEGSASWGIVDAVRIGQEMV